MSTKLGRTVDHTVRTRIRRDVQSFLAEGSSRRLPVEEGGENGVAETLTSLRLVVVRYFLDRPGYGLSNSVARLWYSPPSVCSPTHVRKFLNQQGIALPGLLVEVYLDKFESFMVVEGCEASGIEWDFSDTSLDKPGVLSIRLTDLQHAQWQEEMTSSLTGTVMSELSMHAGNMVQVPQAPVQTSAGGATEHANVTCMGVFSFSMMVGLETVALQMSMFPGTVEPSFVLSWGPYMFFVGGLLQVIVAVLQVFRNNLYGAAAFLGFGSFWFSNGATLILKTYFAVEGTLAYDLLDVPDPVGDFIRTLFITAFTAVLLLETFVMSKLSTMLITLLTLKLVFQAGRVMWDDDYDGFCAWAQLIIGWMTSAFAFWVFLVELTNNIYHRQVFPTYKWSEKNSPEEPFGATGRIGTLSSKAARLRQANLANFSQKIRTAMPPEMGLKEE